MAEWLEQASQRSVVDDEVTDAAALRALLFILSGMCNDGRSLNQVVTGSDLPAAVASTD